MRTITTKDGTQTYYNDWEKGAGGGDLACYVGRYGTKRVTGAVLARAVPRAMLESTGNPEGLPIEVFEKLRSDLTKYPSFLPQEGERDETTTTPAPEDGN